MLIDKPVAGQVVKEQLSSTDRYVEEEEEQISKDDWEYDLVIQEEQEDQGIKELLPDGSLTETCISFPPDSTEVPRVKNKEPSMVPDTGVSSTSSCKEVVMSSHDGWTTKNQIGGPKIISIVPAIGLKDNSPPAGYVDKILSAQTFNTREDTQEVSLCEMNHQKSPLGDRKMKSIQDLEMTTPAPPVVGTTNQQTGKQNPLNYYNYCNTVTPGCSDDVMTPDVSGTDVPASHNKKNKKNPVTPSSPGVNNDDIPVASLDVGDTSRVLKSLNDDVFKTTPRIHQQQHHLLLRLSRATLRDRTTPEGAKL